jgi:magnesium chelatase family protein
MTYRAHHSGPGFVLPAPNAPAAALVRDAAVYPARTLLQLCTHLSGTEPLQRWAQPTEACETAYPEMSQ